MKLIFKFLTIKICIFLFGILSINAQNETQSIKTLIDSADYYSNSNIRKSEQLYNKILKSDLLDPYSAERAIVLLKLGNLNQKKGDFSNAIDYYLESLKINTKTKDSFLLATNYHNIAMVMRFQNDLEASKSYFKKAIKIRKSTNNIYDLGLSYNMIGVIYRLEGDYLTAESYYKKAYEIFKNLNDRENLMRVYGNMAVIFDSRQEYEKAIEINSRAIPYFKSTNNQAALSNRYTNISSSYEKMKNYKTAVKYLDSAIAIDRAQGHLDRLSNNLFLRSNNNYNLKQFKTAIDDYRNHKNLADSVFNLQKTKEITTKLLQVEFDNQKAIDSLKFAEKEMRLQLVTQSEKSKKNTYLILFIGSTILGLITLNAVRYKRNLDRTKLEKEQLESDLLKQKLNATERETQRVIQEKSISLTHKKNLLSQIKHLIKKQDSKSIFKDLNILSMELDEQAKTEALHFVLDENVEKLHVEFEKKLIKHYPDLTKTEREICSLIRANMSIKDVANIKGVSSASVQSARYRIRKKMNLEKGEELHQFVQNLF